ncbi:MAG: hypothetical protein GWP68_06625, partial [Verrucomicrobiaceae bacterium]|nr:hypothetical protein [Verrucomicrobiaceae bacterium]
MMRSKTFSFFAYSVLLMSSSLLLLAQPKVEYIELPPALVEQLSSDDFEVREKAYAGLHKWSEENIKASPELLYKAWKGNDDPEAQSRCYNLMRIMVTQRKFGKGKGFLGIQMKGVFLPAMPGKPAGLQAVRVENILDDTPAQKVGLRMGDLIVRVDELDLQQANPANLGAEVKPGRLRMGLGLEMHSVSRFSDYIKSKQPGEKVVLHCLRGNQRLEIEVCLMKLAAANDP